MFTRAEKFSSDFKAHHGKSLSYGVWPVLHQRMYDKCHAQRTSTDTHLLHDERPLASSRVTGDDHSTRGSLALCKSKFKTYLAGHERLFKSPSSVNNTGRSLPTLIPACTRKSKSKQRGHPKGEWGAVGCTRDDSDRTGGAERLWGNAGEPGGGERWSGRDPEQQ